MFYVSLGSAWDSQTNPTSSMDKHLVIQTYKANKTVTVTPDEMQSKLSALSPGHGRCPLQFQ